MKVETCLLCLAKIFHCISSRLDFLATRQFPPCLAVFVSLSLSLWLKFSSKTATHCAQKLIDIKANKQTLNCRRGLRVVTGIEGIWVFGLSQTHSVSQKRAIAKLCQIKAEVGSTCFKYDTCIATLALAIDLVCMFR